MAYEQVSPPGSSFRHHSRHKAAIWRRPASVPDNWRVVDFGGPSRSGRALPGLGTVQMEMLRLVLDARNIPYIITGHGTNMRAYVPPLFETIARTELAAVDHEQAVCHSSPQPEYHNAHLALLALLILVLWHGLREGWWPLPPNFLSSQTSWLACGKLDVNAVRHGEWWRTATALTLHTDTLHLFSNVIFSSPFLILLARNLGMGIALLAILLSAMLGNAMDVLYRPAGYTSLGFSTAMFSTVGLLCASMSIYTRSTGMRKWLLPLAAGLAFLALLGAEGEKTDYAAHIFGLGAGFAFGAGLSRILCLYQIPRCIQYLSGTAAAVLLAWCWKLALHHS